jgi:hypothetical protein
MKKLFGLSLCFLALTLCAHSSAAQTSPGFDKMKTLVGDWDGKTDSGKIVHVSYKLVSNGTTLMETLHPSGESEMITMYTPDGSRVVMTHYCDAGNQPHMQTGSLSGSPKELDFNFVSATSLSSPAAMHIHHLTILLEDEDHITQKWTFMQGDKQETEGFHFTRAK